VTPRPAPLVFAIALGAAAAAIWLPISRAARGGRVERAHAEARAITGALLRFYQDNTFFPLWAHAPGAPPSSLRRVDLLVGAGKPPAAPAASVWATGVAATLADQLIENRPSYAVREAPDGIGWAGPYLPRAPAPDPWNHRYVVNVGLLLSGNEPDAAQRERFAVWVLSAGPNGTIETPYAQPIATAELGGDDIGARVQ
jgi:hypothetical protein